VDRAVSHEVELKLQVPCGAISDVERLPWLRERGDGSVKRETLVSVYFDTPRSKLRNRGLTLRVRHIGMRRLQTIKAINKGGRSAFGRDEWEEEISGDNPDLERAKTTPIAPLMTRRLGQKLRPIFETVVQRDTLSIQSEGGDLDLAIDRGHLAAGTRRQPISEIEIELKRGDARQLSELAAQLAGSVPAAYGARSKPERGYALSADQAEKPVRARPVALGPEMTSGEAFTVIGLACLDHAISNEVAIRNGDAEGVHQMRVGLRRLRAAISLFKELLRGPETDTAKVELKWLSEQLGPARNWDVLIEQRIRPLEQDSPVSGEIVALEGDLGTKREIGFANAKVALDSERYRRLGLDTALWLAHGEWSRNNDPLIAARRARPAVDFAAEILSERLRKVQKKLRRIDDLDARSRHKLRIAVKKLRYGSEFFAGLFAGRRRDARRTRFVKTLKTIQDSLGALNDIEVHKAVATSIADPKKSTAEQAKKALAIGFVAGEEQQQIETLIAAVKKEGKRLSESCKFWR
jgi:inorganic triphosphatase YgiF